MPAPTSLRPSPHRGACWHRALVVVVLLAAAACSGTGDTLNMPTSTQAPPTPTGTTVPAFDRGRFAAVISLPGAGPVTVAHGLLWVLDAPGRVVRIDPRTNAGVGKPLRVPADAAAIAAAQEALWVASVADGDLGAPGRGRTETPRARRGEAPCRSTTRSTSTGSGSAPAAATSPRGPGP